jgi:hypothetical protein
VSDQDENDVESLAQLDLEEIFNTCIEETNGEKGGFFNGSNLRPEGLPSAKQERDGYKCGIYAPLNWSMFVEGEWDQPSLWDSIKSLDNLNTRIVKSFWACQQNMQDRLVQFRYKLCRLIKDFLQKYASNESRSYIAIARNLLPTNWTYPKELPVVSIIHLVPAVQSPKNMKRWQI